MPSLPNRFPALLCPALFLVAAGSAAQQPASMETISIEQGLSQGMVLDLLQDREGFLWAATKDGLNRYDGYSFKVFTNDPYNPYSLSSNTVVKLFEDSRGWLWVATENAGLNVYDKKTGRFHRLAFQPDHPAGFSGNMITCIEEAGPGRILLGASGPDVNELTLPEHFFEKNTPPSLRRIALPDRSLVAGLVRDARGRLWVSSAKNIYGFDPSDGSLALALPGRSFETAVADPDGGIWAANSKQSPFRWDGGEPRFLPKSMSDIRDLALDRFGSLWVADLSGVTRFDTPRGPGAGTAIPVPTASLMIDRSGVVWIGTGGYGLRKINPLSTRFGHEEAGRSIRRIVSFSGRPLSLGYEKTSTSAPGNLPGGLKRLAEMFPGRLIDNVLVSRSGAVWARAADGDYHVSLSRYDPEAGALTGQYRFDAYYWDASPLIEGAGGIIWMAGYGGHLVRFDPAGGDTLTFSFSDPRRPLAASTPATSLYQDAQGVLWIGTPEGFARGSPAADDPRALSFQWYRNDLNDRSSLNYNHISCFLDDLAEPGRWLWVGTKGGGLNRFDKRTGRFLHLTTADGLPNNVIYGLLHDRAGNIWGSTNRGLFMMSVEQDRNGGPSYRFRNFTKADGLQDEEFNTGAYAVLPDGRLAFGGVNGLNVFDPAAVLQGDFMPRTFITGIWVNNQPVEPDPANGILKSTIETSESIVLDHRQDILTLEFASLDFSAPGQNKYRYRLSGADPDWVEAGARRQVNYLRLPPGAYTFQVQGSNSKGIWSDHVAALHLRVQPPWWLSWWAYLLYVALLAAIVAAYLRFSVNRARLRARLTFETREAERVKELDAVKTRLYTNIAHEFRTPLTVILGMAQQIRDHPKAYLDNGLELISRNGQSLLRLVNEMLDLAKLESGKMRLQPAPGDVISFLRYISESFHSLAESRQVELHFLADRDAWTIDYDAEKLRQIVANLLSNAIKFSDDGGHVYFSVTGLAGDDGRQQLGLRVQDTGIGLSEDQIPHIFGRFYQVDDGLSRPTTGTGIGLALTQELVKLMDGTITVKSPPTGAGKGTEFIVTLPVPATSVADASQTVPATSVAETKLATEVAGTGPLLLLVEDHADVVAYTAACLPDYRLAVARDGQAGFDLATRTIPDLVISDVMMPVMDGFELCRRLKADERTSHIPIILLTARADLDSRLAGLERGADAYLEKPFDREELLVRIRKLLEMRRQLRQHYLRSAGLADPTAAIHGLPDPEASEDVFVQKVKAAVNARIGDFDFNVEQLGRAVHLSQSQLQRKLDALTGYSPNQFIRHLRLNKAKELLRHSEPGIAEVAYDCGFADPGYFGRVFKQTFGLTPMEWRERVRG